jgi:hypothetical protein
VHVFKTTNFGASWNSVSSNLPNAPANDIIINPATPTTLYLATDVGVMISTNDGGSWSVYNTGIPSSVPCHDLTLHSSGKLVVWTHGRSAYYTDVPVGITPISQVASEFSLKQNYPTPFNPVTRFEFQIAKSAPVTLVVYNTLGEQVQTILNQQLSPGSYKIDFDAGNLSSGIYFYRLIAGNFTDTKKMILVK